MYSKNMDVSFTLGSAFYVYRKLFFLTDDSLKWITDSNTFFFLHTVSNKWIREGSQMFKRPCQKMPSA